MILSHELAHFLTANTVGLPQPQLHPFGVDFENGDHFWAAVHTNSPLAGSVADPIAVALTLAAGPLLTLLTSLFVAALIHVRKLRDPFAISAGVFAGLYFLPLEGLFALSSASPLHLNETDELRIALLLDFPLLPALLTQLAVACGLLLFFSTAYRDRRASNPLPPMLIGFTLGVAAYATITPWILPL